jgi:hypothetical protein
MKRVILVGKPTHLRVKRDSEWVHSACGLSARVLDAAYDPRDVDCLRCVKTEAYKFSFYGTTEIER